jgi:hypothetical protein
LFWESMLTSSSRVDMSVHSVALIQFRINSELILKEPIFICLRVFLGREISPWQSLYLNKILLLLFIIYYAFIRSIKG